MSVASPERRFPHESNAPIIGQRRPEQAQGPAEESFHDYFEPIKEKWKKESPEEVQEIEQGDKDDPASILKEIYDDLESVTGTDKVKKLVLRAAQQVDKIAESLPEVKRNEDFMRKLREVVAIVESPQYNIAMSLNVRTKLRDLMTYLNKNYIDFIQKETKQKLPKDLIGVAKAIMDNHKGEFGRGKSKELIRTDPNTGEEELNQAHLVAWVRDRLQYLRSSGPDDPINPWSGIKADIGFREISIMQIHQQEKYWKGKYSKLRDEIETEIFLFDKAHAYDTEYRSIMGSEDKLPGVLVNMFHRNVFTQGRGRLLKLLTLSAGRTEELGKMFEGSPEYEGKIGRAMRRSLLAYYYLSEINYKPKVDRNGNPVDREDKNMFEAVLTPEGVQEFYSSLARQAIKKQLDDDEVTAQMKASGLSDEDKKLFDDAILKANAAGIDWLNSFSDAEEGAMRERIEKKHPEIKGKDDEWVKIWGALTRLQNDYIAKVLSTNVNGAIVSQFTRDALSDPKTRKDFALGLLGDWQIIVPAEDSLPTYQGETDPARRMAKYNKMKATVLAELNIFNHVRKPQVTKDFVKTAMKDATKIVDGYRDENGKLREALDETDAGYASTLTSMMWYWMGISARNDTSASGFDAWSKIINFEAYRLKQVDGRGKYGNMYNVFGIKRLGLTPFEGMRIHKDGEIGFNKTLLEILQGGEGTSMHDFDNFKHFDFQGSAMRQFASDHVNNAFGVYKKLIGEEMDFTKLFTYDMYGRVTFDQDAANKIFDDYFHDIRYALDNPGFLYDKKFRYWSHAFKEEDVKDDAGRIIGKEAKLVPVYKHEELRKVMFNDEVNKLMMYRLQDRGNAFVDKDPRNPEKVARNVFAYLIAKEILSHRDWASGKKRYTLYEISLLESFFKKYGAGKVQLDPKTGRPIVRSTFFNDNEWHQIEELAHTTFSETIMKEIGLQGLGLVTSTLFNNIWGKFFREAIWAGLELA